MMHMTQVLSENANLWKTCDAYDTNFVYHD